VREPPACCGPVATSYEVLSRPSAAPTPPGAVRTGILCGPRRLPEPPTSATRRPGRLLRVGMAAKGRSRSRARCPKNDRRPPFSKCEAQLRGDRKPGVAPDDPVTVTEAEAEVACPRGRWSQESFRGSDRGSVGGSTEGSDLERIPQTEALSQVTGRRGAPTKRPT